jgi:hypothetical protein
MGAEVILGAQILCERRGNLRRGDARCDGAALD